MDEEELESESEAGGSSVSPTREAPPARPPSPGAVAEGLLEAALREAGAPAWPALRTLLQVQVRSERTAPATRDPSRVAEVSLKTGPAYSASPGPGFR